MKNLSKLFVSVSFCITAVLIASCGGGGEDDLQDALKPTIDFFSPTSGLIGSQVNINGSNFSSVASENTVEINGVDLEVVTASESLLTVVIADEAVTGPITVSVDNQSITSSTDFEVTTGDQLAETDPDAIVFYEFNGNLQDELGNYNGTGNFEKYDEDRNGVANSSGFYGFTSNGSLSGNATASFGQVPISTGGVFTISFWIKIRSSSVDEGISYRLLSKRESCQFGDFFDIQFSNSTNPNRLSMELRNDGQEFGPTVSLGTNNVPVDEWVHIAFIVDSSTRTTTMYLDGAQVEENNAWVDNNERVSFPDEAPLGVSTSPCINNSSTRGYEGLMDDLVIFDRALRENEIKTLAWK